MTPGRAVAVAALLGAGALALLPRGTDPDVPARGGEGTPSAALAPIDVGRSGAEASAGAEPTAGAPDDLAVRIALVRPDDDAALERLELELAADPGASRAARLASLLGYLRSHAAAPDHACLVAVFLLRSLAPTEALDELARLYRSTPDVRLREVLHGVFRDYVDRQDGGASVGGAAERAAVKRFFLDSALRDPGLAAAASLDAYTRVATGSEVVDALEQLAAQRGAGRSAGVLDDAGVDGTSLVLVALAAAAREPALEARLRPVLDGVLDGATTDERHDLVAALATGLAAAPPPADSRARVLRFLEASEPPPTAGDDHWRWREAVAAARAGPGAGITATEVLLASIRSEKEPVHLASALVYAEEVVLGRLAPAELDGLEVALERWRSAERDPDRSELYLFALRRIDTLRKLMSP